MARTRKKSGKSRRAGEARSGSLAGRLLIFLLKLVFHPGRLAVLAVVLFALGSRPTWQRYLPNLAADPAFCVAVEEIHVSPAPPAVPDDLAERVFGNTDFGDEVSILDKSLLPKLAKAFERDPWVKRVVRLHKSVPARIDVELEYRDVVAVVETTAGLRPIAADGTVLPVEDFTNADLARYPRVVGVPSVPTGSSGSVWDDAVVRGATGIANALAPAWPKLGMTAIRVPQVNPEEPPVEHLIYALETAGGSRVIWGHTPGAGGTGEPTAREKLDRLRDYLAARGPLDGSGLPLEIDLRPWRGLLVRQLPSVGEAVTSR